MSDVDPKVKAMELFAWVGEDELGSGKVGIKQALVPAGMIPLVSYEKGKMTQDYLVKAMAAQAKQFGKTIHLVKFTFEAVEITLHPDGYGSFKSESEQSVGG